ncbi:outer membrane protein assembly factor BamA [bacterium]|nr:outer membrane protein assembly factor BamA [bacterium]
MKRYYINFIRIFIGLLLTVSSLHAQNVLPAKVLGVSVSGNKNAAASVVRLSSGLREGKTITWDDMQKAIRQVWALGVFSDVRVTLDRQVGDGVYLTIHVKEYPKLEKVVIEGNDKIKTRELEEDIGFYRGQVLNMSDVAKARRSIIEMYAEKGYTLAEVEPEVIDSDTQGRVILKIKINEGSKVQIKRIRFFGNQNFSDGKLRKQLKKTKEDRWWRGGNFDKEKFVADKEKILEFYHNEGYRDAAVLRDSLYYDDARTDMFIDLWVSEGVKYYFGKLEWEGNALLDETELATLVTFKEGDQFSEKKFTESIYEKIQGAYWDRGYIYAQINPVEKLRGADTLDVTFLIEEANPVTIRKIHISGNTSTKERVIRRQLRIHPGDVFSKELLMRSARDLMMLNFFSNVVPNAVPVGDQAKMDLSFQVDEKSTQTANLSIGWSELDKLIGSIGLGMNNLFGNGQALSLDWNFGRYYRSFSLSFNEPWFMNTPTLLGFSVHDIKRDAYYIGYSQRSRGFSIRSGRRLSWPDNYFRSDLIYRYDETELSDFAEYIIQYNPNNIVNEDWPLTTSSITQIFSRNSLDNPEFPTRGSKVSYTATLAGGPLGGNVGYHKHEFNAEFFLPALSPRIVFLARASMGFMELLSEDSHIQYTDYYFMGGSGMSRSIPLRGYDDPLAGGQYRSEGGRAMLKTTFELRFPLINNPVAFGIIFAEAGNTWFDVGAMDPFNLRRSVGIGARIFMPMVGMLGFDYAYGFDNIDEAGLKTAKWKPHFVFGRSF